MNPFFHKIQEYIRALGGELGEPAVEALCRELPLFVSAPYDFCRVRLFGRECLLAMEKNNAGLTPDQIFAQKKVLSEIIPGNVLFAFHTGSKEFCQRLIKSQIAFIIPGRQIFFPAAIVSIREDKFNVHKPQINTRFTPWAQVILLFHLLNKLHGNTLPFQLLQEKLNADKVYVSRSAKELKQAGIAEILSNQRAKSLVFEDGRHLIWEKMQEKFFSPVMQRVRLDKIPFDAPSAGISALSQYSLLDDDAEPTYAVYGRGLKLNKEELREYSGGHLELWKYDPRLLSADGKTVDKLSLYLSLKDHPDPRVIGELQDMMENFEW